MNLKNNPLKGRPGRQSLRPSLRFSPFAWAKLLYLRDCGPTEIGGFGLSAADDPLRIIDILLVRQRCSPVTVAFDDAAVADLFDALVDAGIHPARFGRVWIHTHPGKSPQPSWTDEDTFRRVFGRADWSVMAIVAQNDAAYARLSFHVGPGGAIEIPVLVDYGQPFGGADWEAWQGEYAQNVREDAFEPPAEASQIPGDPFLDRLSQSLSEYEEFYDDVATDARPF